MYACNVRNDLLLGNLNKQSWSEIMNSMLADKMRKEVALCTQNCWMVTTARTAMRNSVVPQFPKLQPLAWVLTNKIRVTLGLPVNFTRHIDYGNIQGDETVPRRNVVSGTNG